MREFMRVTKALSEENRVRILMFLRKGELCVCQIIEMLGLAPSTVSKHMNILYQAGLVEGRKDGRWIYYRLSDSRSPAIRGAIRWINAAIAKNERVLADAKRLEAVKKMDKAELCERYNRC